jgi:hypothetical protein
VTAWLRRAGRGRLRDGATLAWSVAEGSRGRRWRAQRLEDGELIASLLLEVDLAGRPTRLEVDAAAGLLTLHPGRDWLSAHGNVVGHDGVRPLAFEWSEAGAFVIDALPIGEIATINWLTTRVGVGEQRSVPVLVVDQRLGVTPGKRSFVHVAATDWQCDDESISVEPDGTPHLRDGTFWALEVE